ncbi:MAG: hypothetical protein ACLRXQ_04660 [Phascolarctobacterium faecium]
MRDTKINLLIHQAADFIEVKGAFRAVDSALIVMRYFGRAGWR